LSSRLACASVNADKTEHATVLVLAQAEVVCEEWAA
jgi:hypothetical protein